MLISFFDYIGRFKIYLFYFIEIFLLKIIKIKIDSNNTVEFINNINK